MDAILEGGFSSLHLNSAEAEVTEITVAAAGDESIHHGRLLGKLLIKKEQDLRKIRATFLQSWGCEFSIERLQGNMYQFDFENPVEATRVLSDGPWCLSNVLLVLRPWILDWDKVVGLFSSTLFWVQVWGIPLRFCVDDVAGRIMNVLNGEGACQLREESKRGCRLFRFRAPVDLNRSLRRFIQLTINGVCIMGKLRYERLPNYCFSCGKFDHLLDSCEAVSRELFVEERNVLPYNFKVQLKADCRTNLIRELSLGPRQPSPSTNVQSQVIISKSRPFSHEQGQTLDSSTTMPNSSGNCAHYGSNATHPGSHNLHSMINTVPLSQLLNRSNRVLCEVKGHTHEQGNIHEQGHVSCLSVLRNLSTPVSFRSESSIESLNSGNSVGNPVPVVVSTRTQTRPRDEEGQVFGYDISSENNGFRQERRFQSATDEYQMVNYPAEALQKSPFAEQKSQLLEAQKAELMCSLPRSLLNDGFFPPHKEEDEKFTPATQFIVNVPSSVAPILSNLLNRAINYSGELLSTGRDHIVATQAPARSRGMNTWTRRPRFRVVGGDDHLYNSDQCVRNGDILMHNGVRDGVELTTREQIDMERKRKIVDVADEESSIKKSRLSITQPLVEPAGSQAHPAP